MQKVLITGGAGFIGSNFVRKFLNLHWKVYVIEKKDSNLWRLQSVIKKTDLKFSDLRKYNELEKIIAKIKPQVILHFAAFGAYPKKQNEIKEMIETNLLGTINLVNACSKINFKCLINTGSSSEYGIKEKPMREDDLLEPDNFYGLTKAAATMYCKNIVKKMDLPIVNMRPFSVYGYFEAKERLIPTVIKSCLTDNKLELSSSESVRDFIFIEDMIEIYLKVIKNIQQVKGEILNLGTGRQSTVEEVVKIVKKITKSNIDPKYGKMKPGQFEPKNWVADTSKVKKLLSWQAKHNLEKGLEKNIEWFKKNLFLYK